MANAVYYHSSASMYELADESVDLIVTSPPYFNIKDYSLDGAQHLQHSEVLPGDVGSLDSYQDYLSALLDVWCECARVLVPNGKLVVNAPVLPMLKLSLSTHYNRDILNIYGDIESQIVISVPGMFLMDLFIWNRINAVKQLMFGSYPYPSNFYAQNTVEFVGVFVKDGKPLGVDKDRKEKSRLSKPEWVEYTKQIWDIPVPNSADLGYDAHSALMPEEIARRCIRLYSFVDGVVLDPFTGSGTTLKVAQELGRQYVGYEIYAYYQDAIEHKLGIRGQQFLF